MKFTHDLDIHEGWRKTYQTPSDFKKVKHLGKCQIDGDMFAAYNNEGEIHIFKGTMEKTLKTNTWYRHIGDNSSFVYRTGNEHNYGINISGEEFDFPCSYINLWEEATDEEVKEALIKVAKKKGFENIDKLTLKDPFGNFFEKGGFEFADNSFKLIRGNTLLLDGVVIFKDGKWVEILEDKLTLEQRIKNLEDKIF